MHEVETRVEMRKKRVSVILTVIRLDIGVEIMVEGRIDIAASHDKEEEE